MNNEVNNMPVVTRFALASMQVCVPSEWTDEQVSTFANAEQPTGLDHGWEIRKEGDEALNGDPERVRCDERSGCVHVMLDC